MKFTNALGGCANCGALTSPCWRKGPEEARHLCNACGSRYLVKGTLEGYKPGQKARAGGKRPKAGKGKLQPFPGSGGYGRASDSPPKRLRLFKDHAEPPPRALADKAVQVDPAELRSMPPFARSHSGDDASDVAWLDHSPKSHFDRIKQEGSPGYLDALPELKDSSDESTPDGTVARRRARKPNRPQVSTW